MSLKTLGTAPAVTGVTGLTKKVSVVSGANSRTFELADGTTVGEVRRSLAEVMNLPDHGRAVVGGNYVDDGYRLREQDTLEFPRPSGEKGS